MEQHHSEMMALSLAGHDKGKQYVVLRQEGDFLFLVDGDTRLLEKPKRKKMKHVQLIRKLPEDILEQMAQIAADADVRRILKQYQKRA